MRFTRADRGNRRPIRNPARPIVGTAAANFFTTSKIHLWPVLHGRPFLASPALPRQSVFVMNDQMGNVRRPIAPHAPHKKGIERLGIFHYQIKSASFA